MSLYLTNTVAGGRVELAVSQQRVVVNVVKNEWYAICWKRRVQPANYTEPCDERPQDLPWSSALAKSRGRTRTSESRYSLPPHRTARKLITAVHPQAGLMVAVSTAWMARTCLDRCASTACRMSGVDEQAGPTVVGEFGYLAAEFGEPCSGRAPVK